MASDEKGHSIVTGATGPGSGQLRLPGTDCAISSDAVPMALPEDGFARLEKQYLQTVGSVYKVLFIEKYSISLSLYIYVYKERQRENRERERVPKGFYEEFY